MKAYTYKHKKTGRVLQSDKPISQTSFKHCSKDFILVTQVRNGQMKSGSINIK